MAKFISVSELSSTQRVPTLLQCELLYSDGDGTYQVPLKAGTQVHKLSVMVTTAFGSTTSISVGRSSGAVDDYLTDAALNPDSVDTIPLASAIGPFIASDEFVTVTFSKGNATAGRLLLFIELSQVQNEGIQPTATGAAPAA